MPEIIRCPDCGGIVGATETTDEGAPCTCFATHSSHDSISSETESHDDGGLSGTAVMHTQSSAKVCCMCGKDLTGQKRLKDSRGYWCPDCHRDDRKSKEVQGVKCGQCGRVVPEASLTDADGKRICTRCLREERALRAPGSKRYRPVSDRSYKENEKRNLIIMGVVLVVLLILMAISWKNRPWKDARGPGGGNETQSVQVGFDSARVRAIL